MLASTFGVVCSKRAELVLAYALERNRTQLVAIANRITAGPDTGAIELALRLLSAEPKKAEELARTTLMQIGIICGIGK